MPSGFHAPVSSRKTLDSLIAKEYNDGTIEDSSSGRGVSPHRR